MKKSQMLTRAMTILAAAALFNVVACSKAKFESTDATVRQARPADGEQGTVEPNGQVSSCTSGSTSSFCNDDGFQDTIPTFPFNPISPDVVTPFNAPNCHRNTYNNTSIEGVDGVQVWLVVDSSRSFDQVRMAVGRAVSRSFLASLQHQVPVTVSVIPAHAPSSSYGGASSFSGRIYEQVTFNKDMSSSQVAALEAQLVNSMSSAMQESPISLAKRAVGTQGPITFDGLYLDRSGPHSGSDEMGLSSFMRAMDNYPLPANNAFVVMFLADENDICVPELNNSRSAFYFSHSDESQLFDAGYCGGTSVESAFNKAKAFVGNSPFAIGALTYTDYFTIPSGVHAQHSYGAGYVELANRAGSRGQKIDLAAIYSQGLDNVAGRIMTSLGQLTNSSISFQTQFPLYTSGNEAVNFSNLRTNNSGQLDIAVYIDGVQSSNFSSTTSGSYITLGASGSRVDIDFCVK